MSVGAMLDAAEQAVREYCVYLSHDRDAARRRGDRDVADLLHRRWIAAGELAEELHASNPDTIAAEPWIVEEVKTTARHLLWQLGEITDPGGFARRRQVSHYRRKRNTAPVPVGQPPYGWRAAAGGLVRDDDEHQVLERMRALRSQGASYRQIADELNDAGVPARRGRWHPLTVARIVSRSDPTPHALAL